MKVCRSCGSNRAITPGSGCNACYVWKRRAPLREAALRRRLARHDAAALLRLRRRLIEFLKRLVARDKYRTGDYWRVYRKKNRAKRKAEKKAYYAKYPHKRPHRGKTAKRIRGRIPKWADRKAMRLLYQKRREWSERLGCQLHVDHVVPLKHPRVSGLHCESNLQLLADDLNQSKSNLTWPDDSADLT